MSDRNSTRLLGMRTLGAAAGALLGALAGTVAMAQDAATFYKSHKLTLGAPSNAGGGYDTYMRALSRHIAKFVPGEPTAIVQNVPGSSSFTFFFISTEYFFRK